MAALDADHRRDLAGRGDPIDVLGRTRELESLRVPTDQLEERIDLLEGLRDRLVGREVRGHEHRPELSAHRADLQTREIRVQLRARSGGIEHLTFLTCLAECPQEVVVPVDQGGLAKEIGYRSHRFGSMRHRTCRLNGKRGGDANGGTRRPGEGHTRNAGLPGAAELEDGLRPRSEGAPAAWCRQVRWWPGTIDR